MEGHRAPYRNGKIVSDHLRVLRSSKLPSIHLSAYTLFKVTTFAEAPLAWSINPLHTFHRRRRSALLWLGGYYLACIFDPFPADCPSIIINSSVLLPRNFPGRRSPVSVRPRPSYRYMLMIMRTLLSGIGRERGGKQVLLYSDG